MVRPVPVRVGKTLDEMHGPEDFYKIIEVVPGEQVMQRLEQTGCYLPSCVQLY